MTPCRQFCRKQIRGDDIHYTENVSIIYNKHICIYRIQAHTDLTHRSPRTFQLDKKTTESYFSSSCLYPNAFNADYQRTYVQCKIIYLIKDCYDYNCSDPLCSAHTRRVYLNLYIRINEHSCAGATYTRIII